MQNGERVDGTGRVKVVAIIDSEDEGLSLGILLDGNPIELRHLYGYALEPAHKKAWSVVDCLTCLLDDVGSDQGNDWALDAVSAVMRDLGPIGQEMYGATLGRDGLFEVAR